MEKFMFDWYEKARGFRDELPNKFSLALGELIHQARIEAKMSQAVLAEKTYFRQAAISQIEKGKREVTVNEIVSLSYILNKPISFFFPTYLYNIKLDDDKLSILEQELLMQVRRLNNDDLRRLLAQARALADLGNKE
jgi:transcriptional regulator with XRE-family HTH domain